MEEIWKDIIGFEGLYQISNIGRVKSMQKTWKCGYNSIRAKSETILKVCTSTQYHCVSLHKGTGNRKFTHLHKLLAIHFIPNPENKKEVNHKNGNKHDNRIENLEWASSSENRQHAFDTGLKVSPKGRNHHAAKPIMVVFVKQCKTVTFPTIISAVKEMGIGETCIRGNLHGRQRSWKYKFQYL